MNPQLPCLLSLCPGGVDVAGNAVLVEVWGKAVDPYMQVRQAGASL